MSETWIKIKDFVAKWWLLASSVIIAILYYVVQRRGATIADLTSQIQRTKLGEQLKAINETEAKDVETFQKSRDAYLALKRRHPEYFRE